MNSKIKNLFNEWYEVQKRNEGGSFIYDGSLSDENLSAHNILFVCRESNNPDTGKQCVKDFWFKKYVIDTRLYGKEFPYEGSVQENKSAQKYFNCTKLIAEYIDKSISLKNCAYMNINKKGGNSSCDFGVLNSYAKEYKAYIYQEIETLNPQCIVILGKLTYAPDAEKIFREYAINNSIKLYIYDRHPCVYSKDIKNHLFEINGQ